MVEKCIDKTKARFLGIVTQALIALGNYILSWAPTRLNWCFWFLGVACCLLCAMFPPRSSCLRSVSLPSSVFLTDMGRHMQKVYGSKVDLRFCLDAAVWRATGCLLLSALASRPSTLTSAK